MTSPEFPETNYVPITVDLHIISSFVIRFGCYDHSMCGPNMVYIELRNDTGTETLYADGPAAGEESPPQLPMEWKMQLVQLIVSHPSNVTQYTHEQMICCLSLWVRNAWILDQFWKPQHGLTVPANIWPTSAVEWLTTQYLNQLQQCAELHRVFPPLCRLIAEYAVPPPEELVNLRSLAEYYPWPNPTGNNIDWQPNEIGKMNEAQRKQAWHVCQEWKTLFSQWDTNNDGKLSTTELQSGLESISEDSSIDLATFLHHKSFRDDMDDKWDLMDVMELMKVDTDEPDIHQEQNERVQAWSRYPLLHQLCNHFVQATTTVQATTIHQENNRKRKRSPSSHVL